MYIYVFTGKSSLAAPPSLISTCKTLDEKKKNNWIPINSYSPNQSSQRRKNKGLKEKGLLFKEKGLKETAGREGRKQIGQEKRKKKLSWQGMDELEVV